MDLEINVDKKLENEIVKEFVNDIKDGIKNDVLLIYGNNFEYFEFHSNDIIGIKITNELIKVRKYSNMSCEETTIICNSSINAILLGDF